MRNLIYVLMVLMITSTALALETGTYYATDVTQSGDNTFTGINIFNSGLTSEDEIDMTDNPITDVGYIDFNLIDGIPQSEGRLIWNDDDGTLNLGLKGGIVNLQMGQEMLVRGKNITGSSIGNGIAIRIIGGSGNFPTFGFSNAADLPNSLSIGIATEVIASNQFGYVTTFGLVRELDTSSWSAGDILYLADSLGGLTNTIPTDSSRKVMIGHVVRESANEGIIMIHTGSHPYFSELSGPQMTNKSVPFVNTSTNLGEDNANFTYDSGTTLLTVPDITATGNAFVEGDSGPEGQIFYHDESPTLTIVVNSSAWTNVVSHGAAIINTNGSGIIYNTTAGIINTVNGGNWKASVNLSYETSTGVPEVIHSIFLDDVEQEQCHSHRKTAANDVGDGDIAPCIITTNADSEVRVKVMSDGGTPTVTYNAFGLTIWK